MNYTMTLHGANPRNLFRAFNIEVPEKIIDFSTNTNVLSWPEINLDIERLASSYPDPECSRLREIISVREEIPVSKILFTNGINEAIFVLAGLFGDRTAIFQPCYTEYSRAFVNAQSIFSLEYAGNFRHVIICNPNNPTGRFIPDLSKVIKSFPETIFVIDEAYIDFLTNYEPERLAEFPNAVILRSLTKIFHLSGARIGYVIADEKIIDSMRARLPSWNVNAFAQELALKFLLDNKFYSRTRDFYSKNVPEFMENLRFLGFDVIDSDVHYFLVRVRDDGEIIRRLLTRGIVVRHTRNFSGLEGKFIRVATRLPDENEIFLKAMKGIIPHSLRH